MADARVRRRPLNARGPLKVGRSADHGKRDRQAPLPAFRDLEGGICDCTRMAKFAAQIVTNEAGIDEELGFAVGGRGASVPRSPHVSAVNADRRRSRTSD